MAQLFALDDTGKLTLANVALSTVTGAVSHTGSYTLFGNAVVNGTLDVDTINVRNLVTNNTPQAGAGPAVGNWIGNVETEINGTGLQWTWGQASTQLIYRTGNRLWTNGKFDLDLAGSYNIDNVPVLSAGRLGDTVVESNLRKIGTLSTLRVTDDVALGDFAFFNSTFGRLGLGTEDPSLAIDIVENNVNIIVGSPDTSLATIGTASNHDLGIVTDNITRILVKNNGEVVVGDSQAKNAVLRVYGSLYVDNLISDTRVDRSTSLQFQATSSRSIFGLGLTWNGTGASRQLIMRESPDRLWSTESIDIEQDKAYYINGQPAVSATALGGSIIHSSLTTVGVLSELTVSGKVLFDGNLTVQNGSISAGRLMFNDGEKNFEITANGFNSNGLVQFKTQESNVVSGDKDAIEIGSKTNNRKPVKVFGPLSVGVNNPEPSVNFTVGGDVSIGNRRFTNGTQSPTEGSYDMGDMCWNTEPRATSYIGWVCVAAGNPGVWLPFGEIKSQ